MEHPRAWLYRIATNAANDHFRRALFVGVLSVAYAWHAKSASRGGLPLASPLAAMVLLLGLAALLTPLLLDAALLPASGAAMPWRSADYQVPAGAWTLLLPLARALAAIAPWLVLVAIALQAWYLVAAVRAARQAGGNF